MILLFWNLFAVVLSFHFICKFQDPTCLYFFLEPDYLPINIITEKTCECENLEHTPSADLDTQLMQLKLAVESKAITKMPYKEKETLVVMMCFMFRSALDSPYIFELKKSIVVSRHILTVDTGQGKSNCKKYGWVYSKNVHQCRFSSPHGVVLTLLQRCLNVKNLVTRLKRRRVLTG